MITYKTIQQQVIDKIDQKIQHLKEHNYPRWRGGKYDRGITNQKGRRIRTIIYTTDGLNKKDRNEILQVHVKRFLKKYAWRQKGIRVSAKSNYSNNRLVIEIDVDNSIKEHNTQIQLQNKFTKW